MRKVVLSTTAYRDLLRLEDWLAERSPAAARRMSGLMDSALTSLETFAERGRPGPRPDLRELVVPFGAAAYFVQYRIVDDTVIVARIKHSREGR